MREPSIHRRQYVPPSERGEGTWRNEKGYRSSAVRAWIVIGAAAALTLVQAFIGVVAFRLNAALIAPVDVGALEALQGLAVALDAALFALLPLTTFAFLMAVVAWLSRATDNCPHLAAGTPSISPRWTVIWWFVPFANLVKGYQAANDVARRMAWDLGKPMVGVLVTWWVAFWVSRTVLIINRNAEIFSLEDLQRDLTVSMVAGLSGALAVVLAGLYVWRVERLAQTRQHLIATGALTPAATGSTDEAQISPGGQV